MTLDDLYSEYDNMLDDCYPAVRIGDHDYNTSHVLKRIDYLEYTLGFDSYVDSLREDGDPELNRQLTALGY